MNEAIKIKNIESINALLNDLYIDLRKKVNYWSSITAQTAKMNLLKPDEYIKYVLENIDNTKASKIDKLLPFNPDLPKYLKYNN